jgi:hypothetical protein
MLFFSMIGTVAAAVDQALAAALACQARAYPSAATTALPLSFSPFV